MGNAEVGMRKWERGRQKRLKVGGELKSEWGMGNGGKIEGEILGRWEGENGECGMSRLRIWD